jgi:hypothetical protein
MIYSGLILHLLLAAIVLQFWRNSRGMSVDELLERSAREHHVVKEVHARHPLGGTWKEYRKWVAEVEQHESVRPERT